MCAKQQKLLLLRNKIALWRSKGTMAVPLVFSQMQPTLTFLTFFNRQNETVEMQLSARSSFFEMILSICFCNKFWLLLPLSWTAACARFKIVEMILACCFSRVPGESKLGFKKIHVSVWLYSLMCKYILK